MITISVVLSSFSIWCHFPATWKFSIITCTVNSLSLPSSKNVFIFPSFLKHIFARCWAPVDISILWYFKDTVSSFSSLCGFWLEICSPSPCCYSACSFFFNVSFLSSSFQDFFFHLIFSSLIIMWLGLFFFEFILFGDYHAFWICKLMSFTNVGNFPPLFLQMFFSAVISFSVPSGILKTHVRC